MKEAVLCNRSEDGPKFVESLSKYGNRGQERTDGSMVRAYRAYLLMIDCVACQSQKDG